MARLDYDPANDYYALLGVDSDADTTTIQRAYRQKAKLYHPDINPGEDAKEKFQLLNEAYNVLSDSELRQQYNNLRWRFTTYSRPSNPYEGTSFREETMRRASQWSQPQWEDASGRRRTNPRVNVEQDIEPGYWMDGIGLGGLRPVYKGIVNLTGSPYRYILLLIAVLVVVNGIFIAAGFVFADDFLLRESINPVPTSTLSSVSSATVVVVPTTASVIGGSVPTLPPFPSITPQTQVINCDPRTSFNLPVNPVLGSDALQQLYATITLPGVTGYEVRAYPLDESVTVPDVGYFVLSSRELTGPINFAQVADLRPLPSVEGFYRFTLELTMSDGGTFTGCDVTLN